MFNHFKKNSLIGTSRSIVVALVLLYFPSIFCKGNSCEQLSQIFEKTFYDKWHYRAYNCDRNIYHLLREAKKLNMDLSEVNVIILFNSTVGWATRKNILPLPMKHWSYHVILESNGKIMDYDFTNEPQILDAKSYYKKQFLPWMKLPFAKRLAEKKMSKDRVRVIKAEDFLEYNVHGNLFLYYKKDFEAPWFNEISWKQFLQKVDKPEN